ncbi:MAG: Gfo/Idh/MocA family oxidoreductase [Saprospiraceae bacterium]|nr:Gfo/Idh/MocA family oxidoreductase [Saprospiraceae bacterium]
MKTDSQRRNRAYALSRRNFCRTTALATGGLMTSPLAISAMGRVHENNTLRLAVVGCGGRGAGAAVQALNADPQVELVAMADAFIDRLEGSLAAITEHFGGEKTIHVPEERRFVGFDAYRKAIDLADVVILATPPGFRPVHFSYAIDQGKHVFMEKPVATDAPGVRKVLAAAKRAKAQRLNVVVGLQRHYENKYLALHRQVKDGAIGQIRSGQVYWNDAGVWVRKRQPGQSEMEYQMRNWYYFNWLCGDHILEQHIHNIDVANWFIGGYPVSAQGMGGREVRKGPDHGEIFDHHFVEFTYANGAVIASQCRHQSGTYARVDEVFQGTKGSLVTGKAEIRDLDGSVTFSHPDTDWGTENPYQIEHDRLFAAIRNGDVISDAENGARSTLTAIMGRMATYSGKVITWDDAMNAQQQLVPDVVTWDTTPPTVPDASGHYPIPVPGVTTVL